MARYKLAETLLSVQAAQQSGDDLLPGESHSMERTATATFTGNHAVVIHVAMVGTCVQQRLDDRPLSAWAIAP